MGLFQINTKYQDHLISNPHDLLNPEENVRIAARVYEEAGRSWKPWISAREKGLA